MATRALCFASDLVFGDGVGSVMKCALCKIEERREDLSQQMHAGRGVDVGHNPGSTGEPFQCNNADRAMALFINCSGD